MIFIYIEDENFQNKIKYVFDTVFFILGIEYRLISNLSDIKPNTEDIYIIYASHNVDMGQIPGINLIYVKQCNRLFGSAYLKENSVPEKVSEYTLDNRICNMLNIISIYNDNQELFVNRIEGDRKVITTNLDIISDMFFMLTRYEEVVKDSSTSNDGYDRFPAKNSISCRNGFIDRPIVNEDIELLWSWIGSFKLGYKRREWWGGNSFVACLTHDVDWVLNYGFKSPMRVLLTSASLLLRRLRPGDANKYLFSYIRSKLNYKSDPYWTFDNIMELERSYGGTSSFYFMSGGTTDFDNRYKAESRKVEKLIRHIENCDFEAGYHGSFDSYKSLQIMLYEKHKLDKLAISKEYGCRQHYLRFKVPYTWRIQKSCNLLYDTTLGYADCDGFRCGICLPYKPYDILNDRVLDIWEIPLIAMDATLDSYLNLSSEEAINRLMKLIDIINNFKGVFTLLTHNTSFSANKLPNWQQNYKKLLERINNLNGIGMSGREVIRLWKKD